MADDISPGLNKWLIGDEGESNHLLPYMKNKTERMLDATLTGIWKLKGQVSASEWAFGPFYWMRHNERALVGAVVSGSQGLWEVLIKKIK